LVILELKVLLLECDGVIEGELGSTFEDIRDGISGEVLIEERGDIAEDGANAFDWDLEGDGGQKGECIVGASSNARDGTIGENYNSFNRFGVLLHLCGNILHVECVLLTISSIGEPRCVEDANLGKRLCIISTFIKIRNLPLRRSCS